MKNILKNKTILLAPFVKNNDITKSDNLLTSVFVKMSNLLEGYGVDKIYVDSDLKRKKRMIESKKNNGIQMPLYNLVVARGKASEKYIGKGKPVLVFNYCGINAGFFFDQYYNSDGECVYDSYKNLDKIKDYGLSFLTVTKIKNIKA